MWAHHRPPQIDRGATEFASATFKSLTPRRRVRRRVRAIRLMATDRRTRLAAVQKHAGEGAGLCRWCPPCSGRPSQARAGTGFSRSLCDQHQRHKQRHGHPAKRSYTAPELAPFRRVTRGWLRALLSNSPKAARSQFSSAALSVARDSIAQLKRMIEASDLRDSRALPVGPDEKARAVLGRLYSKYCLERDEGVRDRWPRQISSAALAERLARQPGRAIAGRNGHHKLSWV